MRPSVGQAEHDEARSMTWGAPCAAGEDLTGAKKAQKHLSRLKAFVDSSLSAGSGGSPALLALVRKLLAGLAAVENLPVPTVPAAVSSSSHRNFSYGAIRAWGI